MGGEKDEAGACVPKEARQKKSLQWLFYYYYYKKVQFEKDMTNEVKEKVHFNLIAFVYEH